MMLNYFILWSSHQSYLLILSSILLSYLEGRGQRERCERENRLNTKFRLYIKQYLNHPPVTQSVAIFYSNDGIDAKQTYLTVFTSIAKYYFYHRIISKDYLLYLIQDYAKIFRILRLCHSPRHHPAQSFGCFGL